MNEGKLFVGPNGRWEIDIPDQESIELTSGSIVEVEIQGHWIITAIECDMDGYYAVVRGVKLYDGMRARRADRATLDKMFGRTPKKLMDSFQRNRP